MKRDGTPIETTPEEGTTRKETGKTIQTGETDTGDSYVTTVGVCPKGPLHWTRG